MYQLVDSVIFICICYLSNIYWVPPTFKQLTRLQANYAALQDTNPVLKGLTMHNMKFFVTGNIIKQSLKICFQRDIDLKVNFFLTIYKKLNKKHGASINPLTQPPNFSCYQLISCISLVQVMFVTIDESILIHYYERKPIGLHSMCYTFYGV